MNNIEISQQIYDYSHLTTIDKLDNLVIVILGAQNSGKSYAWKRIFEKDNIRTIKNLRSLKLSNGKIDVFLVNGSPEEREVKIEDIITVDQPKIVLCSVQDIPEARHTLTYFIDRGYFMFIHWLNPGYNQQKKSDCIVSELLKKIPEHTFIFDEKDGNNPEKYVMEIKYFLDFWAKRKNLLN